MLVLKRRQDQEIEIECRGVTITLKVLAFRRRGHGKDEVNIGIDAPADVKITRKEILDTPDPKETP